MFSLDSAASSPDGPPNAPRIFDSAALLAQGIRDVMAGKVWLDQEQLQTALTTEVATPKPAGPRPFTERERQVLSFVFEGLANNTELL